MKDTEARPGSRERNVQKENKYANTMNKKFPGRETGRKILRLIEWGKH